MADEHTREAERQAHDGVEARAAVIAQHLRAGRLTRQSVYLASGLGDEATELVEPHFGFVTYGEIEAELGHEEVLKLVEEIAPKHVICHGLASAVAAAEGARNVGIREVFTKKVIEVLLTPKGEWRRSRRGRAFPAWLASRGTPRD